MQLINQKSKKRRFKNTVEKIHGLENAESMRIKRKKQTFVCCLPGGFILKMRLLPLLEGKNNYQWLVSLAISKSKRQINDWLKQRNNTRAKKLRSRLTGTLGIKAQIIALKQVRKWIKFIPEKDLLFFRCESAMPLKQFNAWAKWFQKRESKDWIINSEFKYFVYCK